ncbi:MAG: hypothetical protein CMO63_06630 [Verrucomicrobiales bacterium]|nr:hypothetical protein [Verrucomicrobiales bacterium]
MDRGTATKIGVIGALYFSQGIPNGFFRHTVPVVFRDSGVSLEQIALFYPALYTPWMLKFIWTILVDRFHSEKQGKYRSWIIPLQLVTAGVMGGLALWQLGDSIGMFVLGVLLINVFSSMQDVSTDGHAISLLQHGERGWGNAIQVGTFWLGYVVGGGLILMLIGTLGWSNLLFAMAVIYILATIPIALSRAGRPSTPANFPPMNKSLGGIVEFMRQPKVLRIFALIAAFRLLEGFIRAILPTMLKDWGMGFEEIGFLLGIAAPISALAGAIVAGGLANRLGRLKSLLIFGGLQALSAIGYLTLTAKGIAPSIQFILPVIVIDHFISGMTTVALFSIMMDWSRKTHGGTDYTCMDCVGVFAMMFGAGLSYWLAAEGGYGLSFGVALPLIGLSVFAVWRLYSIIQQAEPWRSLSQAETTTA